MTLPRERLLAVAKQEGTPLYVYSVPAITKAYTNLAGAFKHNNNKTRILYAMKANAYPQILRHIKQLGGGLECVSVGEVKRGCLCGFPPENIFFTSVSLGEEDMRFLIEAGVTINIDSLSQLERYGYLNPGGSVSVRINEDIGAGFHEHVVTGGVNSKFGIHYKHIKEVHSIAQTYNLHIKGLHQHIGSNIYKDDIFIEAAELLMARAFDFDGLEFLDFGGGFGVPYESEEPLNIDRLGDTMNKLFSVFKKKYRAEITMLIEPGRYLVAESGVLLMRIEDIKQNSYKKFICVDSGFNHFIRPALYGVRHTIKNISRNTGRTEVVTVAGNICESGDIFANDCEVLAPHQGDILALYDAGAYGFSMSSEYNLYNRPKEHLNSNLNLNVALYIPLLGYAS